MNINEKQDELKFFNISSDDVLDKTIGMLLQVVYNDTTVKDENHTLIKVEYPINIEKFFTKSFDGEIVLYNSIDFINYIKIDETTFKPTLYIPNNLSQDDINFNIAVAMGFMIFSFNYLDENRFVDSIKECGYTWKLVSENPILNKNNKQFMDHYSVAFKFATKLLLPPEPVVEIITNIVDTNEFLLGQTIDSAKPYIINELSKSCNLPINVISTYIEETFPHLQMSIEHVIADESLKDKFVS